MADLKIRRRVSGKFGGPGKPGQRISASANTRPSSGSRPGSKSGAPNVTGGIAPSAKTVHSPISDMDELAPGSEIEPGDEALPEEVTPDFLENAAGVDEDEPKSAIDADIDRDAESLNDLADQEQGIGVNDGQLGAENEKESLLKDDADDEHIQSFYKPNKKIQTTAQTRIKQARLAVPLLILLLGIGGIYSAAPSFLVGYLGETLIENPTSRLAQRSFGSYRRLKYASFTDRFSWEGRRAGKLMTEMGQGRIINGEFTRYTFQFDPADPKKVVSVTEIKSSGVTRVVRNVDGAVEKLFGEYMDVAHPISSGSAFGRSFLWKNDILEALHARIGTTRESILRPPDADDGADAKRTVNKRFYDSVSGDEKISVDADIRAPNDADDTQKGVASALDGAADSDGSLVKEVIDQLEEGVPVDEMDEQSRVIAKSSNGATPSLINFIEKITSGRGVVGKIGGVITSLFDVTDLPNALCLINGNIRLAEQAARYYSDIKLVLYATVWLGADDGVRNGAATSRFARELMHRVTLSDENGNTFASAPAFKFAQSGSFNEAINNQDFGAIVNTSGETKGVLADVEDNTDIDGCEVWEGTISRIAINTGLAAATIFGSGVISAAASGQAEVSATLIKQSVISSLRQTFSRSTLKQLPRGFVMGAVGGITIEGIGLIAKIWAEKQMHLAITGQETGGTAGQIYGGSAESLNESATLRRGYTPATVDEYVVARKEFILAEREEMKKTSAFNRFFNINARGSLARLTAVNVAMNVGGDMPILTTDVINSIAKTPQGLFGSVASFAFPSVSAKEIEDSSFSVYTTKGDLSTSLAMTPTGSLLPIMKFADKFDPIENKQYLIDNGHIDKSTFEPSSDSFIAHMENCVEGFDILSPIEEPGSASTPDKDCLAQLELTQRYKAHLIWLAADKMDNAALDPESVGQKLKAESAGTGVAQAPSAPIQAEGLNGYVIPCAGDNRAVARVGGDSANWSGIPDSGSIGVNSIGESIKVYIRDACPGQTSIRTIVVVGSIHGSENGGQLVAHELLFNEDLPDDVRIVAIPELCSCAGTGRRGNANGVDLNRNNSFNWLTLPQTQTFETGLTWSKGTAAGSEPETQAINRFLSSLGKTNLSLHYHDSLNYVVGSSQNAVAMAATYASAGGLRGADDNGRTLVTQRGSLDGWYNQETGTPTMLIEMGASQNDSVIQQHIRGLQAVINGNLL